MHKGGTLLVTAAVLACSACLGEGGRLEIRSVNRGLEAGPQPVPYRIAESRAQLALGNVALALEGFRKAHREDPASIEALAGMADCYERMGRFDLSRRNFEMALALAPRDSGLLTAFAMSLSRQGLSAEAASVHREATAAAAALQADSTSDEEIAAATALVSAEQAQAANTEPPVQAAAPAPAIAPVGSSVTIALAPPRPAAPPVAKPPLPEAQPGGPVGSSVTIALKPARPAPPAAEAPRRQPRLERMSLTEVALITGSGPKWMRPQAAATRMAAAAPRPDRMGLRVLNAARVDKLAARTRAYLGRFGWRNVAVGDAAAIRTQSVILYPVEARTEARKLAAKLGFATAARRDVRQLTILLGRDAAGHPDLRSRG